ncbi:response regulator transcription factor [Anaerosacchariphilus polymeriproducens]|uniref:Stage 0 sporulation protein A homolog n=1 Tax=Anaerosacchariphilus polymeriproducens TaxID=1812858 RepID=A0A371AZS3_9FIRM|nr:response regulator transcription factor [Anaerosacchariphilus polymeriproducens]RDU25049.1 DNA-binding response regulator [Anaerosacchariphilus polymeriproducens]
MDKVRILVVDDDFEIREIVKVLLESEGYEIIEAADGKEVIEVIDDSISLIILDVMMPGMNGYDVCSKIRRKSTVPILFLTAKTKDSDLETGFLSGGDDYLAKPFSFIELVARVKGLLRRYYIYKGKERSLNNQEIRIGDLLIHEGASGVTKGQEEITLTNIEFGILMFLVRNKNKVVTTQEIYEAVWKEQYFSFSNNTVMVHIRKLREKIEDNPHEPIYIKTVWGKGYRIG